MEGLEEDSIGAGTSRALHDELTEDDLLLKSRLHWLSLKLNFKEELCQANERFTQPGAEGHLRKACFQYP